MIKINNSNIFLSDGILYVTQDQQDPVKLDLGLTMPLQKIVSNDYNQFYLSNSHEVAFFSAVHPYYSDPNVLSGHDCGRAANRQLPMTILDLYNIDLDVKYRIIGHTFSVEIRNILFFHHIIIVFLTNNQCWTINDENEFIQLNGFDYLTSTTTSFVFCYGRFYILTDDCQIYNYRKSIQKLELIDVACKVKFIQRTDEYLLLKCDVGNIYYLNKYHEVLPIIVTENDSGQSIVVYRVYYFGLTIVIIDTNYDVYYGNDNFTTEWKLRKLPINNIVNVFFTYYWVFIDIDSNMYKLSSDDTVVKILDGDGISTICESSCVIYVLYKDFTVGQIENSDIIASIVPFSSKYRIDFDIDVRSTIKSARSC